jgi:hypothetical protein
VLSSLESEYAEQSADADEDDNDIPVLDEWHLDTGIDNPEPFRLSDVPSLTTHQFEIDSASHIGSIAPAVHRGPNLDWALVRLDEGAAKPNVVEIPGREALDIQARKLSFWDGDPVVVLCGRSGILRGQLKGNRSALLVAPGSVFVDTIGLTIDGDRGMFATLRRVGVSI